MPPLNIALTSFNQYPRYNCILHRPERYHELLKLDQPTIARGQGSSYGDAALNADGHVITTQRLNRFIAFDRVHGILTAEAGVTLGEILTLIIPQGWFLPVTPGTQLATLGGCIAADVHGKNHPSAGSFSNYIAWLELILANGEVVRCDAHENSELFWATAGGMGLTGIIGTACLKLKPIHSSYMKVAHTKTSGLNQILEHLNTTPYDTYQVSWLNPYAPTTVQAINMTAQHAHCQELPVTLQRHPLTIATPSSLTIPFNCPKWCLNKFVVRTFNKLYQYNYRHRVSTAFTSYQSFFYPLDRLKHWPRLYGKNGFIQYQSVIPIQNAEDAYGKIFEILKQNSQPITLAVLKRFGQENPGLLSFAQTGFTLALDLPILNSALFTVLDQLDDVVQTAGGRVYLAKDARLKPETFQAMYPKYRDLLTVKNKFDPHNNFCSSLARRLQLC